MALEIWHNPRCSKSRAALEWLQARGIEPEVRLYLADAPKRSEIRAMLKALKLPAAALLRKEGAALKDLTTTEIVGAMARDPSLIERPVVRNGDRAVIARPPEAIEPLL